jgi:hypothetical protein
VTRASGVVRAKVKGGGVGATRNGVANKWAGTRRGPVVSGWVQRGDAVGAALTGGAGNTVRSIWFSNRIKLNQVYFKRIQICPKL